MEILWAKGRERSNWWALPRAAQLGLWSNEFVGEMWDSSSCPLKVCEFRPCNLITTERGFHASLIFIELVESAESSLLTPSGSNYCLIFLGFCYVYGRVANGCANLRFEGGSSATKRNLFFENLHNFEFENLDCFGTLKAQIATKLPNVWNFEFEKIRKSYDTKYVKIWKSYDTKFVKIRKSYGNKYVRKLFFFGTLKTQIATKLPNV